MVANSASQSSLIQSSGVYIFRAVEVSLREAGGSEKRQQARQRYSSRHFVADAVESQHIQSSDGR